MKILFRYIKYTVYGMLLSITFSCSDDFLNDNLVVPDLGQEYYTIYISPEWDTNTYPIYCPKAGNAKFSISHAPEWLNISDVSEQFIGDMAYITCSASTKSEYDKYGAYNVIMTLEIEGVGKYPVILCYLNEGAPTIEIENNSLTFGQYYGEQYLNIINRGEGILIWEIVSYPEWVSVNLKMANNPLFYNEGTSVNVIYNSDYPMLENILSGKYENRLDGEIIIASNDKKRPEITVDISMILGEPNFYCDIYDDEIDFGRGDTEKSISFTNYGNGILIWQIEDSPEWITFSQTQGYLDPYSSNYTGITVTCDRSNLPAGENHATFTIRSNDINNPVKRINVKCRNGSHNSENVRDISGTVTDAWFDKHSDLLYISTRQPNRLLVYDAKTKTTTHEIELPNAPNCFSMSDDKRRIAVGHGGKISFIDMSLYVVEKTVEVESAIFDIEWSADDWCCYTPVTTTQYDRLKWINAVSDEQYETVNSSSIYEKTVIKKVPNRNYMIATRPNYSPSGIVVFDSQTREHINYFHESIDMFWFSEDGNYLFDSYKQVYRTSALTAENISPIAQLDLNEYVKWIDHNSASNSLWVIRRNYYYDIDCKIWQLEANDFTLVNTFFYDDYYLTTFNGILAEYQVEAHYVFANSAGSEVIVIKNLIEELQGNAWSLEHVK